jgi:hypothetical protein
MTGLWTDEYENAEELLCPTLKYAAFCLKGKENQRTLLSELPVL